MREQIQALEQLQKIDSEIKEIEKSLKKYPDEISEYNKHLNQIKEHLDAKISEHEELLKTKKELEQQISNNEETIKKSENKLFEIKTHKQYEALQKEIAETKRNNSGLEDSLLNTLDRIEAIETEIKEEETKLESTENEYQEMIDSYQKIIDELKAKYEPKKKEREEAEQQVKPDILPIYRKVISRNGSALAEVKNEMCTGCNMNIPPQLYNEVLTQNRIIQCPNCKKILYASSLNGEQ